MKVVCEHCGLPFSVGRVAPGRPVYCCSGCALAARVPVDADGQFPVNAALVTALSSGFVFFNQALFWLLGILLARRADAASATNAGRLALASLAIGAAVWLALAIFQTRAGARRGADFFILILALAGIGAAFAVCQPGLAVGANALLAAWALRGLARKKAPAKK